MIPLKDDNPTTRFPWLTILLIATNIAVFAYELTLGPNELQALMNEWGFTASRAFGDAPDALWPATALTSMFLHAGWLHVLGNMLYLWIFGNNVEDRLGHFGFAVFYLAAGIIAIAAQSAINPASALPMVGASGAVAGMLGAYVVLYPRARVLTLIPIFIIFELAALPAVFIIGFWFVMQLAQGIGALASTQSAVAGVAFFAHIGGFVAGALAALPMAIADRRRPPRQGYITR